MADAEGRPTTEHELNRQLADTIGASVEQLLGMGMTEADNTNIDAALEAARRGTPLPGLPGDGGGEAPKVAGQPGAPNAAVAAPVAPVIAQEGDIDWESTKAPNGLYLGKYKSKAEAVRGVAHTVAMAKTAFSRSEAVDAENARLQREVEQLRNRPAAAPAVAPQSILTEAPSRGHESAPSSKLADVLAKVQEVGHLDAEDLSTLVSAIREDSREDARQVAREEYSARQQAISKEEQRWEKVEQYMATEYPESVNFTGELALFVKTHPKIARGVEAMIAQDMHEDATAFAWEVFDAQRQKGAPAPAPFVPAPATTENVEREIRLDAADQVRREAVDAARRDAGVIGPGAAGRGVHENADQGASAGEYDEAVAQMRQGNGQAWRSIVYKDDLNHPLFG